MRGMQNDVQTNAGFACGATRLQAAKFIHVDHLERETMNKNQLLAQALQDLMDEVRRLNMEQTVQRSAFVLLARHLAAHGCGDLGELARDTERMGCTQDEPGWQEGHAEIAGVLRLVHGLPSGPQK